ncbi:MAG: CDP-alcohol phosphatidyltransferase family protein [Anaerolineae bacterium]
MDTLDVRGEVTQPDAMLGLAEARCPEPFDTLRTSPVEGLICVWAAPEAGQAARTQVCHVPVAERLLRVLQQAGLRRVAIVATSDNEMALRQTLHNVDGAGLDIHWIIVQPPDLSALRSCLEPATEAPILVVEGAYLLDPRIVQAVVGRGGCAVAYDSRPSAEAPVWVHVDGGRLRRIGGRPAGADGVYVGLVLCPRAWLAEFQGPWEEEVWLSWLDGLARKRSIVAVDVQEIEPYVAESRRPLPPFWFRIQEPADAARCKDRLVEQAQKGTLDLVAWYVHRPIENWIVRHIADLPITPNQMSLMTSLVAFGVTGLFLTGHLLPGILLALVVNVMDGLDGKLARVKGLTSRLGSLEHSFDCLYEQSWYIAFAWAMYQRTGTLLPLLLGVVMLLFDTFARHVSMQFKQVMGVSLADSAPVDRLFRRFDGRRNIYSLHMLVTILLGIPLVASFTMPLHAAVTAVVYVTRAGWHLRRADRGVGRA